MRRKTVMAYLNTVPLRPRRRASAKSTASATACGRGTDRDFAESTDFWPAAADDPATRRYGRASAEACAVADRRGAPPVVLPRRQPQGAGALTDDHLDLLASADRDLARTRRPRPQDRQAAQHAPAHRPAGAALRRSESHQCAAHPRRALLGEPRLYDLDRLDLTVDTTINQPAQKIVSDYLQSLAKPEAAAASGLIGFRLLKPDNALGPGDLQLHAVRKKRRSRQRAAHPGRQSQPAVRHQQPGPPGSRLHRQVAHPGHLSGNHRAAARRWTLACRPRRSPCRRPAAATPLSGWARDYLAQARRASRRFSTPRWDAASSPARPKCSLPAADCTISSTSSPRTITARWTCGRRSRTRSTLSSSG